MISVLAGLSAVMGGAFALGQGGPGEEISVSPTAGERSVAVASESTEAAAEEEEVGLGEDPIDVLLLGIDRRPEDASGESGVRSDAIIVARVMPDTGEIRLLSVPRDLYLEVESGEQDRVNAAYVIGGVDQTRSVVERYTGIGIDHYAVIDFDGFEAAIDALGGVKVKIREGEYPEYWRNVEPGKERLNGERALEYARYRDSAGGDLDRIGHQQQIIAAVKNKALNFRTITRLPELIEAVEGNVESDLGPRDGIAFVKAVAATQGDSGTPVKSFQLEGEGTYLDDGRQVLTPNDEENKKIISDFLN